MELCIWPLALVDEGQLAVLAPVDHRKLLLHHLRRDGRAHAPERITADEPMRAEAWQVLLDTFRLLHEHRCSPFLTGYRPVMKLDRDGKVRIDWSDYDRTVEALIDGTAFSDRVPAAAWPMPVDETFPAPPAYGAQAPFGQDERRALDSPAYAAAFCDYLSECAAHSEQRDWLDQHFVWLRLDGGSLSASARYGAVRDLSRIVHSADNRLRLVADLIPQDMGRLGWWGYKHEDVSELVDIWAPPGRYWDRAEMAKQRALGKGTWLRLEEPPYTGSLAIEAPPVDARTVGWQAFREGAKTVLLKHANDWPADVLLSKLSDAGVATDRWLIYPGRGVGLDFPLPSIRLKRLRRGIQDGELLRLLERNHRTKVAELIAETLFKFGGTAAYGDNVADARPFGWVVDPHLWHVGRRLAIQQILRAVGDPQCEPAKRPAGELDWLAFLRSGRKLRLLPMGARLRSSGADAPGRSDVEFTVMLANETRYPVSGVLRFKKLPAGWRPVRNELAIAKLAPMTWQQAVLIARTNSVATNTDGLLTQQIVFDAGRAGRVAVQSRLGYIVARKPAGPIRVDGDLSDWPAGLGNVAGDFLLVARQTLSEPLDRLDRAGTRGWSPAASEDRPTQQTKVFIQQDGEHLYVAFNCAEAELTGIRTSRSNDVRYDGTTPVGEDLVEVLIDPLNTDSTGTSEIYHIVVKASGAGLCERGIGLTPPTGERQRWPAEIAWAVSRGQDRWFAEIEVPLAPFGETAKANRYWRINFARFQARLHEYASWSGALGHVYSPRRMGNLVRP